MNIIFLDIDGVMNHMEHYKRSDNHILQEFCPVATKQLKRIIATCDAKIVVSSSWRRLRDERGRTVKEWLFPHYGLDEYVVGSTPRMTDLPRGLEIEAYLATATPLVSKFIIIDDDNDMVNLTPYLVQTDFRCGGLTEEKANEAIALFTSQEEPK